MERRLDLTVSATEMKRSSSATHDHNACFSVGLDWSDNDNSWLLLISDNQLEKVFIEDQRDEPFSS